MTKINVIYVPKPSTLDEVIASDDSDAIKKAKIVGIFLEMYSKSLRESDGSLTKTTNEFTDRLMAL